MCRYNMERQLFDKGPSFLFVVKLCFVPVDRIMCERGAVTYLWHPRKRCDCSLGTFIGPLPRLDV